MLFSHWVVSNSVAPHGLQQARLSSPSLSLGVCSNSCSLSQWCHPTISFFVALLHLPSIFPSIMVFSNDPALYIKWPKYWNFIFSLSPSNEYTEWFLLGLTGLISLQCKGLSRAFSSTTVWKHQFFGAKPSLRSNSHIHT